MGGGRRGGPDVTVGAPILRSGLEPVVGLDRLSVEGRHTMRLELGTRRLPCRVNEHEVDRRLVLRPRHRQSSSRGRLAGLGLGTGFKFVDAARSVSAARRHAASFDAADGGSK